ncbi:hypothetical protein KUTeg_023222 [Tegillarca granosa]|uniref:Uncharacterized protein n=1 Tax=Tegillarca granosa TaxID=220873 RepID=A0ABQ9E5K4_TEGGR|nr:hypothetical protein KUTeg_023222 [Tegillarca granosa]
MAAAWNNLIINNTYNNCEIKTLNNYSIPGNENDNPIISESQQQHSTGQGHFPKQPESAAAHGQEHSPKRPQDNATKNDIEEQDAKYKKFAIKSIRISSFKNFPTGNSQKPEKEALAEAGFFYTGSGDGVRCFHCGIGLQNWEKDDNPWVEHARYSKSCRYVMQQKGFEFINLVQNVESQKEEALSYCSDKKKHDGVESNYPLGLLQIPAIQSLIQNEYKIDIVHEALQIFQNKHGSKDYNATDLLEIIFEIEEEQKSTCVIKKEETAVLADQTSPKQVDDTKPGTATTNNDSGYSEICADALMKKKLELKQRVQIMPFM